MPLQPRAAMVFTLRGLSNGVTTMRYLILLLLASAPAMADVTFRWTQPTKREDGSALPATEIAGYKLDWTLKGVAQPTVTVPSGSSYLLPAPAGRVCGTLKTVDTDGLESVATAQACKWSKPLRPTNLTAG